MEEELVVFALVMIFVARYANKALDVIEPRIARQATDSTRKIWSAARGRRWDLEGTFLLAGLVVLVVALLVRGEFVTLAWTAGGLAAGIAFGRLGPRYLGRYRDLAFGVAGVTSMSATIAYYQI